MEDHVGYRAIGKFSGWELRDPLGRRIGRVLRVFVDGVGRVAHVEVVVGAWGARAVLLPVGGVAVDQERRVLSLGSGRSRLEHRALGPGQNPTTGQTSPPGARNRRRVSVGAMVKVEIDRKGNLRVAAMPDEGAAASLSADIPSGTGWAPQGDAETGGGRP